MEDSLRDRKDSSRNSSNNRILGRPEPNNAVGG